MGRLSTLNVCCADPVVTPNIMTFFARVGVGGVGAECRRFKSHTSIPTYFRDDLDGKNMQHVFCACLQSTTCHARREATGMAGETARIADALMAASNKGREKSATQKAFTHVIVHKNMSNTCKKQRSMATQGSPQ